MFGHLKSRNLSLHQGVFYILLLAGWASAGVAGEPQPWGIHILWPDTPEAELGAGEPSSALTVQRRLEATAREIEALEASLGPYSPELTPKLVNAAREAQEYGVAETALEFYKWALHSTRINNGLSTAEQLPLLESILELLRDKGDPIDVGRQIDYFYRLLGRGAEPWTDQRLEASVRWLSVQSEIFASIAWSGKESDVLFVIRHGDDMTKAVCESDQWQQPWCKFLSLEVLKLYYLVDFNVDPLVVDTFGVSQDRYPSPYQQNRDQSPGEFRLRNIESTLGSSARGLIDRALKIFPNDEVLLHAKADWLMLKGRQAQALDIYRELQLQGSYDFSSPGALPEIPKLSRDHRFSREWSTFDIRAEVTPRGNLKNVEVNEKSSPENKLAGFARRQLRDMRFRPALTESGEATESTIVWQVKVLR